MRSKSLLMGEANQSSKDNFLRQQCLVFAITKGGTMPPLVIVSHRGLHIVGRGASSRQVPGKNFTLTGLLMPGPHFHLAIGTDVLI